MNQSAHHSRLLLAVLLSCLSVGVGAADYTNIEGRVGRLERILENQSGSELLMQMQQLQTEMQELRGMLESQKLELDKLKRQQRDQYLDIDSRLSSVNGGDSVTRPNLSATVGNATPTLPSGVIDASGGGLPGAAPGTTPPQSGAAGPTEMSGPVGIPSLPSPETVGGNERDAYTEAFELLKERKYDEAITAFNDLLRRYPQGQFSDNARYWLAETYYVQRNLSAALSEFERLLQLNPQSPKAPGAMLKIGFIQYDQKDLDQAKVSLERVIATYPNSTEARLAKGRLERIGQSKP
ncbi:tol-pal system protein YbgF [Thiorhodococcus fuscus]|uniref:Cell division coordinator CpoB n=1 Tax=Thiorhodococcus fuscus TaxID=527200 RepID=A0ABW4Y740_9GAMM